ncbi:unnamed protein product [Owenia fusiformis]|uniref:Uncharacterized protein n=1 Tax=Owenia fusiformis TaxID=6347 RepID=A0A8J1UCJ2_OWEFU|nr:unnamed protein product [Owenia fusiformis]
MGRRMLWACFSLVLMPLVIQNVGGQLLPYCNKIPPGQPTTGPPLPALPPSFYTKVEMKILNRGRAMDVEQYFDGRNQRASIRMTQGGQDTMSIINFPTNELFNVFGTNCGVQQLNETDFARLFMEMGSTTTNPVYSSKGALKFGPEYGQKYIGLERVRGMPVNHWQSCHQWEREGYTTTFTVDYYFTGKNLNMTANWSDAESATPGSQFPVRAVIMGRNGEDGEEFNHMYDFVLFKDYPSIDEAVYQTPSGVYCAGRTSTLKVPQLGASFRFNEEILLTDRNIIENAEVWYDFDSRLLRFDFGFKGEAKYPTALTEVHDFNTGVAYKKDRATGRCKIEALGSRSFDTKQPSLREILEDKDYVRDMRGPNQLFYLDDSYIFTGKRVIRGLPCNAFISTRDDYRLPGQMLPATATFEFCFLAANWLEIGTGSKVSMNYPLSLDIWIRQAGFHGTYNFFNFDNSLKSGLAVFDVDECFTQDQKKDIVVRLTGGATSTIRDNVEEFKASFIEQISNTTKIGPLRFHRLEVDYDKDNVYVTTSLHDRPPTSAMFSQLPGNSAKLSKVKVTNVTLEECSALCYENRDKSYNNVECNGFDYCNVTFECYLSGSHYGEISSGTDTDYPTCYRFSRNVNSTGSYEKQLNDAFRDLKTAIYAKQINIIYKGISYMAMSLTEDFKRKSTAESTGKYLTQFKAMAGKSLKTAGAVTINSQVSLDECAQYCVTDSSLECKAFDFCPTIGLCVLSDEHPDDSPDQIKDISSCTLYARDYLYKFNKLPGKVIQVKADATITAVATAQACAGQCIQKYEQCKSFEFCEETQKCLIKKGHIFDLPDTSVVSDPSCDYYSKKYIDDFKQTQTGQISLKNKIVFQGLSAAACAQQCVEQLGLNCKGFDYCPVCVITSDYLQRENPSQMTNDSSLTCLHYTRTFLPNGNAYIPPPKAVKRTKGGANLQIGAVVGISVGTALFGVIIGGLIVFVITKSRSKSNDNMAMGFVDAEVTMDSVTH